MAIPEQELTGREKSTASQAANSTYRSGHIGVFEMKTPEKKTGIQGENFNTRKDIKNREPREKKIW